MKRTSNPELARAKQRIRAIGDDCMTDEFPMFQRRLTTRLSLLVASFLIGAQLLDYLVPGQFGLVKTSLWIAGFLVLIPTLVLRLWPKMWR
jgi:hypothetical protein